MPAKRKSAGPKVDAPKADAPKADAPKAGKPAEPENSTDPRAEPAEEPVPMNRAERRARGRGKTVQQQPAGRGKIGGPYGPVQNRRNFANRRTG